mgnify:CR=1 FL=1
MVRESDTVTQLRENRRNKVNEISGLERRISSETDPDKKRDLERELATAKRELVSIDAELTRALGGRSNN